MGLPLSMQQPDAVVAVLGRIATAQTITSWVMLLLGIMALGLTVAALFLIRSMNRVVGRIDRQLERLGPHTEPLVANLTRITEDARGVTDEVRHRAKDLMKTVEHLNKALREGTEAAETRVREFGAVLDVVKAEAEEILLDTAATARGIHATAESLRAARGSRRRRPLASRVPRDGVERLPEPEVEEDREPGEGDDDDLSAMEAVSEPEFEARDA